MTKATVLIADDDPLVRDLFALLLQNEGYSVLCAGNGKEAVERMREAPDLVVSDLVMPVMDGSMFVDRISDVCREAGHKVPPVLLMSASAERLREFRDRGMVTLDKPIAPAHFIEAVTRAVAG